MKIREEREAKRATMDGRHEYILSSVADMLKMSLEDAEEFMLDEDQVCLPWPHPLYQFDFPWPHPLYQFDLIGPTIWINLICLGPTL